MAKYLIRGGRQLEGELSVPGGKNAMLPILAASVLNSDVCIIKNCPKLSDAFASQEILKALGCRVEWDGNTLIVDSSCADRCEIPENLMREMRSSIVFLGSVLGRFKKAKISFPGGCELGPRPIDLHLKALRRLGAVIVEENGYLVCETKGLKGDMVTLDFPSVGATENAMLASVLAVGKTVILNAAKEPEIIDLQNFLNGMGADISGAGTDTVVINGVEKLHGVTHSVMPDRIVAGTFLAAAAITGGSVKLNNIVPEHIQPVISKLREAGCTVSKGIDFVHLKSPPTLIPIDMIRTHPHPGLPK